MQPNPVEVLNLDRDSTTLSNKKRTPPICRTISTNINQELQTKHGHIIRICKQYCKVPRLNNDDHTLKVRFWNSIKLQTMFHSVKSITQHSVDCSDFMVTIILQTQM
jgi:hypothetical protein